MKNKESYEEQKKHIQYLLKHNATEEAAAKIIYDGKVTNAYISSISTTDDKCFIKEEKLMLNIGTGEVILFDTNLSIFNFVMISIVFLKTFFLNVQKKYKTFKVPKIIDSGFFSDHAYIIFEPLPMKSKFIKGNWEKYGKLIADELKNNTVKRIKLKESSWFSKFNKIFNKDQLLNFYLHTNLTENTELDVCLVHGDLHNGNIRYGNGKIGSVNNFV